MPHPAANKQPELRNSLVNYLIQESAPFFPNMDWEYYLIDRGYVEEPKGAVYLDRIQRKDNYPANLDHVPKIYRFHLVLKFYDSDYKEGLDIAAAWEEEIGDRMIKKLQIEGYEGFFKGIRLDPKQPSVIQDDKNQDDSGLIMLHMFLIWDDDGIVESSLNIPDYLLDNS